MGSNIIDRMYHIFQTFTSVEGMERESG